MKHYQTKQGRPFTVGWASGTGCWVEFILDSVEGASGVFSVPTRKTREINTINQELVFQDKYDALFELVSDGLDDQIDAWLESMNVEPKQDTPC